MSTPEIILLIGIVLTFLSSLYSIFSAKKSKYIETITTQRIKNLEIIKNEVAIIVTNIQFALIKSTRYIENEEFNQGKPIEETQFSSSNPINAPLENIFNINSQILSCNDLIIHLNLLKLRINLNDNKDILGTINYFIELFTINESIDESHIKSAHEKLNIFLDTSQKIINSEWEKVKEETKGNFFIFFC